MTIAIAKFIIYFLSWTVSAHLLEKYKVSSNICMLVGFILGVFCYNLYN